MEVVQEEDIIGHMRKNTDSNWYKFNDNVVSTLNVSKVVSPEAYCLFYRLKELSHS